MRTEDEQQKVKDMAGTLVRDFTTKNKPVTNLFCVFTRHMDEEHQEVCTAAAGDIRILADILAEYLMQQDRLRELLAAELVNRMINEGAHAQDTDKVTRDMIDRITRH